MVKTPTHLVDSVFRRIPFWLFLISFPMRIGNYLEIDKILRTVLKIGGDEKN